MQDFKPRVTQCTVDPQERSRRLAQVYSTILSWPDSRETEIEPADVNLDEGTATGSAS